MFQQKHYNVSNTLRKILDNNTNNNNHYHHHHHHHHQHNHHHHHHHYIEINAVYNNLTMTSWTPSAAVCSELAGISVLFSVK